MFFDRAGRPQIRYNHGYSNGNAYAPGTNAADAEIINTDNLWDT